MKIEIEPEDLIFWAFAAGLAILIVKCAIGR